jgi:hypothetical protein
MGGITTSTTLTTLSYAAIWQSNAFNKYLSDKMTQDSTHVLGTKPGLYSWNLNDQEIIYNGDTYKIIGRADDVMSKGEITVVPLELLQ